jgi:site-specific recombinase XerD
MHSLRRTAVIEIFENKQDLRLAQILLGQNILTTSNYLQDSKRSIQDQLRECLC